jgi:hypothetical protein
MDLPRAGLEPCSAVTASDGLAQTETTSASLESQQGCSGSIMIVNDRDQVCAMPACMRVALPLAVRGTCMEQACVMLELQRNLT